MRLSRTVIQQFRKPEGFLGHVAGWIMAYRASNRQRAAWTVNQLDIPQNARVLELGCGPGVGLQIALERFPRATVVGIDHSPLMVKTAKYRNRRALANRLQIEQLDIADIDQLNEPFHAVFSCNVLQFLPDTANTISSISSLLSKGGYLASTFQHRGRHATEKDAKSWAENIVAVYRECGFIDIKALELPLKPVPAICVLGKRPGSTTQAIPKDK